MEEAKVPKTYGAVPLSDQLSMTGLEFVQGLASGSLPLNSLARTLGYDVAEVAEGKVVVTAMVSGDHLNPSGTIHGGLVATLLDTCMGLAIRTQVERGKMSTTLEFKISFLRSIGADAGLLRAEGVVLACGRCVGMAEGRLTDSSGRLLAHGTTTCLIT
jgi:uncharacterized protein (TIGR00369 family)